MATDKDFLAAGAQIVAGAVIHDGKTVGHYNHGNFILTDVGMQMSEELHAEAKAPAKTKAKAPAKPAEPEGEAAAV